MKTLLLLICTFFPSYFRLVVWRFLGFKVGKNAHVSIFTVVIADFINIGSGSMISVSSSVVSDVPDNVVIEGNPGKIIGKRKT